MTRPKRGRRQQPTLASELLTEVSIDDAQMRAGGEYTYAVIDARTGQRVGYGKGVIPAVLR